MGGIEFKGQLALFGEEDPIDPLKLREGGEQCGRDAADARRCSAATAIGHAHVAVAVFVMAFMRGVMLMVFFVIMTVFMVMVGMMLMMVFVLMPVLMIMAIMMVFVVLIILIAADLGRIEGAVPVDQIEQGCALAKGRISRFDRSALFGITRRMLEAIKVIGGAGQFDLQTSIGLNGDRHLGMAVNMGRLGCGHKREGGQGGKGHNEHPYGQ